MKFKIGDKVRLLDDLPYAGVNPGGIATVTSIISSTSCPFEFYVDTDPSSIDKCDPNCWELVKEETLQVRFKRLNKEAVLPAYAKPGDAGVDLTAVSKIETKETVTYGTGIAVEIPEGHLGLLMPRSSVVKKDAMLKNSVGLIDSGYRGELGFVFHKTQDERASINIYNIGDRIGQLVILPFPKIEYVEVPELSETERGTGGYGSTGK